ncbi:MAG: sigma-54 dependent transcriptional regulator [Burkholderiaceae bacterium]
MAHALITSSFPGLRVLVVEDVMALAIQYRTLAARLQVQVTTAGTMAEAMRQIPLGPWHAALVDLNLPDGSGFEVMQALLRAHPACSVVVITAEDSLDNAVRASQAGAFDFIEKPVEAERLLVTLRNALHASQLSQQVASLQTETPEQFEQFIGHSPEMQTVYRMLDTVAASNAPVCVTGESGTGKELAAQAIHARSPRKAQKLVAINCAAIPKELMESELFGHAKGAYTGAVADRAGVFLEADKGTLFLDEIAELELSVQAKLLRVLQTGEVKRLGEDKTRIVDLRIVCATHRNLAERMRAGEFREDLFYRLFVVSIELPPLRRRGGDIALIARHLLTRYASEEGKQFTDFEPQALAALRAYAWPGNVRELINVIRAVVALHDDRLVQPHMLPAALTQQIVESREAAFAAAPEPNGAFAWFAATPANRLPPDLRQTPVSLPFLSPAAISQPDRVRPLADIEREAVDHALRAFGGNVAQAARALQVNPSTLYRKIQVWTAQGSLTQGANP